MKGVQTPLLYYSSTYFDLNGTFVTVEIKQRKHLYNAFENVKPLFLLYLQNFQIEFK